MTTEPKTVAQTARLNWYKAQVKAHDALAAYDATGGGENSALSDYEDANEDSHRLHILMLMAESTK